MNKTSEPEDEPGIVLGVFLGSVFVALLIATVVLNPPNGFVFGRGGGVPGGSPMKRGTEEAVMGFYFMYVGLMFILSYYFNHKTFFFRWWIRFLEFVGWLDPSTPSSRKRMLFFGAIFGVVGGWFFLWAIGWL